MEHQTLAAQRKGNPLPRRGQVKARIIGGLVRSIIPSSSKTARSRRRKGPAGEMTPSSPATSGYASDESSEA
ncbi:hypothetical protein AXF42_Ash012232 [Apostasia shenzhenica]|uniref:Uncharacterized protein n=1 Tax=Apostasia shenzhenica TaxID=1088818 RepID=A0A2I0B4C5_9ASPA|nr:hypothetical protein AXF42_Ash012232 [Apostasia shenzhenica]